MTAVLQVFFTVHTYPVGMHDFSTAAASKKLLSSCVISMSTTEIASNSEAFNLLQNSVGPDLS